jgi:alginate O-acetyltransferase complex protein AlgF
MMNRRNVIHGLALAIFGNAYAHAQDREAGLYAPLPPPGSAFIRVFNGRASLDRLAIADRRFATLTTNTTSPYAIVKAGAVRVTLGGSTHETVSALAGGFATLVLLPTGKSKLFRDPPAPGPMKASLQLYNLTQTPLSLRTPDNRQDIIANTAPQGFGQRLVNAARTGLLLTGNGKSFPIAPILVERGAAYSVFAWSDQGRLRGMVSRASTQS